MSEMIYLKHRAIGKTHEWKQMMIKLIDNGYFDNKLVDIYNSNGRNHFDNDPEAIRELVNTI